MKSLMKIYQRELENGVNRYLLFDYESAIPYIYTTDRLYPVKLYMEPHVYSDITENTIDLYACKNQYIERVLLSFDSDENKQVIEKDNELTHQDMVELLTKTERFSYRNKNTIMMCKKLSDIISYLN